jgi:hypothetical protein
MKIEYLKKKRFLFLVMVAFLTQFSVIKTERAKNFSFNKHNKFYEKRFLTQTINDVYQSIIATDLSSYTLVSASQEKPFDEYIFQLTTTFNEEKILDGTNQNTQKLSIIDLDKCKSTLYGSDLDQDKPLILLKLEKETELVYEKNIQFEIYNPIDKKKINLEECKTFNVYIPVTFDEKLEKLYNSLKKEKYNLFDINDPFYNDICTPYKTLNSTDISLSDRKSYFQKEFASQSNCKYLNYSSESKLMAFTCTADKKDIDIENINKFNGEKALLDFYKNQKKSYLKFFQCYKSILKLKITKNFGSLIIIFIIIINLALAIIFIIKRISPLRLYIAKFIFIKPKNETHNAKENITQVNAAPKKKKSKTTIMKHIKFNNPSENDDEEEVSGDKKSGNLEENVHNRNKKRTKTAYKKKKYSSKTNNFTRKDKKSKTTTSKRKAIETTKNDMVEPIDTDNNNSENLNMNSLEDYELNNLELEKASQVDKRSFCRIFYSIIRRNQVILFTFFSWKDYNLWYFKFARFFFLLSTEIAMNALFFFDNSIHELFLSKGKFDFVKFILQIIISSLVSHVIDIVVRFFIMTDKDIYRIKELDNNEINKIMVAKTLKCINIKLSSFFIFIFVFMIVYFYLITSFCAIYENTQTILLINSLASFAIYLIYPILIYFIFTIFKYIGLKTNSSCMYKTGNIIPIF